MDQAIARARSRSRDQYIYIFENAGAAIGVTMPHPHGQIYSFPYIPPYVETELQSAQEYLSQKSRLPVLRSAGRRTAATDGASWKRTTAFVAFVPYAARFPSEGQIYPRRHVGSLAELDDQEKTHLASLIQIMRRKYDALYGFPMPMIMVVRQAPAQGAHPYFHLHVEFFPIQRSATKLKYLAGVETGAGTFLNDTIAEEQAEALRKV